MQKINLTLLFIFIMLRGISQDFEVSPSSLFFSAEPGESQTKYIHIKNHSNKPETFIIKRSDYSVNNKGEGKYEEAGSLKNSIADWLTIVPSFFELEPNMEKEVAISMQQPANEFGSKWGIIFVSTAKEQTVYSVDKGISAGINVSGIIAINVYQTPGTNKNFKAKISNLTEISENTSDTLRNFTAVINNLGDIITNCKITLIATNIKTSEEFVFPQSEIKMFPKTSRKVDLKINKKMPQGVYSLAAILDYGSKTNLEGTQLTIKVE